MTRGSAIANVTAFVSAFLFHIHPYAYAGSGHPSRPMAQFALTLDDASVQQVIMLFYDRCEKQGLVFDPSLGSVDRKLTLKTPSLTCSETKGILVDALQRAGVTITRRGSYDLVTKSQSQDETDGWQESIYQPRFRDALELAQMAQIAIRKGAFAHQRRGAQVQVTGSAQTVPDQGSNGASITSKPIDKLIFFGPPSEVLAVESLLARLDVPYPQIELQASIFEFQRGKADGDAVTAAVKLFGAKLGIAVNGGALLNSSTLKLSLPNLDAALALLDGDTRFKYVSRPKVLVKDGEQVSFTAGQDVRVVGQTVVSSSGQATQSITTVTAGVTLQATPYIRGDIVEVMLHQLVSDFAPSPNADVSIVRRDLTSRLLMQPGFVYVVGGLQSNRSTQSRSSFLGLPIGSSRDMQDTEVLLLLTVRPELVGILILEADRGGLKICTPNWPPPSTIEVAFGHHFVQGLSCPLLFRC